MDLRLITAAVLRPVELGEALLHLRVDAAEENALVTAYIEAAVQMAEADTGRALLTQTAIFEPKGLAGLLYWYLLYPIHAVIFSGMVRKVAAQAR